MVCGTSPRDVVCVYVGGRVDVRGDDVEREVKLGKLEGKRPTSAWHWSFPMAQDAAVSRWLGLDWAVLCVEVRGRLRCN